MSLDYPTDPEAAALHLPPGPRSHRPNRSHRDSQAARPAQIRRNDKWNHADSRRFASEATVPTFPESLTWGDRPVKPSAPSTCLQRLERKPPRSVTEQPLARLCAQARRTAKVRPLQGFAATPTGTLAVVVHDPTAVRRPPADLKAGFVPVFPVEVDVAVVRLDRFFAAFTDKCRHRVPSLTPKPPRPSPTDLGA
jgi:hypothetical protein